MVISRLRGLGDAAYDALYREFAGRGIPPAEFSKVRPGRPYPDPETCLKIQCGVITQDQAGYDLLADCSFAGYAGSQSCADPLCAPMCGQTAATVARASQPLPVAPRVAQMFLDGPVGGCDPIYPGPKFGGPYSDVSPCECGAGSFIAEHPVLSTVALLAGSYLVYAWRSKR